MSHHLLLIEDNADDVDLTKSAFADSDLDVAITVCMTGGDAVNYLKETQVIPDFILLDLNLPDMTGHDVLKALRALDDPRGLIPVCILSSSKMQMDIDQAYRACSNSYLSKPISYSRFVEIVREMCRHWFTIVELPNGHGSRGRDQEGSRKGS